MVLAATLRSALESLKNGDLYIYPPQLVSGRVPTKSQIPVIESMVDAFYPKKIKKQHSFEELHLGLVVRRVFLVGESSVNRWCLASLRFSFPGPDAIRFAPKQLKVVEFRSYVTRGLPVRCRPFVGPF